MTRPETGLDVRLEGEGGVLRLVARPGGDPPLPALASVLEAAVRRQPSRLLISWEGPGPFLAPLVPRPGRREDLEDWLAEGRELVRRLAGFPAPVVALVPGLAAGPPLELALACRARVALPSARLGFPDLQAGTLPGWGGLERAVALAGPTRALEWLLSGAALPAEMARGWGLVDRVVTDPGGLEEEGARVSPRPSRWPLPDRLLRWLPFLRRMAFGRARLRAARMAPEPDAYPAPHRVVRLVELCLAWPPGEVAEQVREAVLEAAGSPAARELPRLLGGESGLADAEAVVQAVVDRLRAVLPDGREARRRVLAEMVAWGFDRVPLGRRLGEESLLESLGRGRGAALLLSLSASGVEPLATRWLPAILAGALEARTRAGEGVPVLAIDRLLVRELGWPAWRGGPLAFLARLPAETALKLLAGEGMPEAGPFLEEIRGGAA